MPPPDGAVSLAEFASSRRNASSKRWCDGLPAEIVDEIMASNAGSKVVSDWLKTLGFDEATPAKCNALVDARKKRAVG